MTRGLGLAGDIVAFGDRSGTDRYRSSEIGITRAELEERLRRERIDPAAYDLDGLGKDDSQKEEFLAPR